MHDTRRDRVHPTPRGPNSAGCPLSALVSQLATPGAREIITDLYRRWHDHLLQATDDMTYLETALTDAIASPRG